VESAELSHTHADHIHPSVPEHAAHLHDATPASAAHAPGTAVALLDIDGVSHGTLAAPARGRWTSLFFVRTDCPIANQYAPEIKRICADYAATGVECLLVFVDGHLTSDDVRQHVAAFDYELPAILDRDHTLVARAGATVTPEAAIFAPGAELEYRGRIDNLYVELGRPRRQATERNLRNALDDLVGGRPVRERQAQATGCYIE
jgi:AhpC/TSA family